MNTERLRTLLGQTPEAMDLGRELRRLGAFIGHANMVKPAPSSTDQSEPTWTEPNRAEPWYELSTLDSTAPTEPTLQRMVFGFGDGWCRP